MKLAVLALLFFLFIPLNAQESGISAKFDADRNAATDLATAVKKASASGKRILLDVGGEWCSWCHRLDTLFMKSEALRKALDDNFITVKVNYSKENKNTEFLSSYPKIEGYPHWFFLDSNGKLLHSQNTGEMEQGKGYSIDKVLAVLQEWSPKRK